MAKNKMDEAFQKVMKSRVTLPLVLIVCMLFTSELAGVFKAPVMLLLAILLYLVAYSQGKKSKEGDKE